MFNFEFLQLGVSSLFVPFSVLRKSGVLLLGRGFHLWKGSSYPVASVSSAGCLVAFSAVFDA